MDIRDNKYFIVNLNENSKSFTLLIVNWDSMKMGIISRGPESQERNKLIGNAWIYEDGELDCKFNVHDGDKDSEFDQYVIELRTYPLFEDYKIELSKIFK